MCYKCKNLDDNNTVILSSLVGGVGYRSLVKISLMDGRKVDDGGGHRPMMKFR